MGQTLPHGVYLPDEGERNCYDGLAGNWQLLDGAVGTVAEHTTALAGKAPAVHTHTKADITDLLNSNFIPSANNSYDLGSFSYQWNNLYAKNYYYNGVAWGLDKANTWSANNVFAYTVTAKRSTAMSANSYGVGFEFRNHQDTRLGYIQPYLTSNNENYIIYGADNGYNAFASSCIPTAGSTLDLGTSTNKWKTLNGVNPGALSLLNRFAVDNIDTTNWDKRATNGIIATITASVDCWINVQIQKDVDFSVWVIGSYRQLFRAGVQGNGKYLVMLLFPMDKNSSVNLYTPPLDTLEPDLIFGIHSFFPCFGNV